MHTRHDTAPHPSHPRLRGIAAGNVINIFLVHPISVPSAVNQDGPFYDPIYGAQSDL